MHLGAENRDLSPGRILAWDTALCLAFCVRYSAMVRHGFRPRAERVVPPHLGRALYTIASAVMLYALALRWQESPTVVVKLPFTHNYTLRNLGEPGQNLLRVRLLSGGSFYGYYVECRTRKAGLGDENIPEEGLLVTLVNRGTMSPTFCYRHASAWATSNYPTDIWYYQVAPYDGLCGAVGPW